MPKIAGWIERNYLWIVAGGCGVTAVANIIIIVRGY
jgi:hypothetical protein